MLLQSNIVKFLGILLSVSLIEATCPHCRLDPFIKSDNKLLNSTITINLKKDIQTCLMSARDTNVNVTDYSCDEYICAISCQSLAYDFVS